MKKALLALSFILVACHFSNAQNVGNYLGNEKFMYAETKQVNQFFRRFNCEEDLSGKRLYKGDPGYHDPAKRKSYIRMLFDQQNKNITKALKEEFINDVTESDPPKLLDFYAGRWFAEVHAKFKYNGETTPAVLFLSLEKQNLGIKWVITNVYFYPFTKLFYTDSSATHKFLHPMSHELDFMNLIKVFKDKKDVEYYFDDDFKPDFRTLFLYEVKRGELKFETVENVKFHFFQIKDWYFEISEFNRRGGNSGWLISNLTKIPEDQKDKLLKYIYYEK